MGAATDIVSDIVGRSLLRLRLFFLLRLGNLTRYQPNPFASNLTNRRALRACDDRFDAISHFLPATPLSTLDVGCHLGYFTFRLAERGGFCVGLDRGAREINTARSLAKINRANNVAFARYEVNQITVDGLPHADIVLCLSVFHHWVKYDGVDEACSLLSSVAGKARRYFVFETGQPEETEKSWAGRLDFMNPDPQAWAAKLLGGYGFSAVHYAGDFPSGVSRGRRHLHVAVR